MIITVDNNKKHQKFSGFGASGAWWAQIVGGWENIDTKSNMPVRDRITELLYNAEKGIGLHTYRYNLGTDSAFSDKGIYSDFARRTESFSDNNGDYDFSKDKNAVDMMEKAVENGAKEIIFFVNSPLETMTRNGLAHHSKLDYFKTNLKKECAEDFCKYTLDVTEHFVKKGLPVKYLSPVNEPLWKWDGGQEGCHYSPKEAFKVMELFAKEIKKRPALSGLKLSGMENGDIRWFNKSYTRAMLKSPLVRELSDGVDFHSYFIVPTIKGFQIPFIRKRVPYLKRFRKWMDKNYPDVPLKMSEWTHMQGGRDCSMDSALNMAQVMYEDLSILNVTTWQHWIACSHYDYCDGLIYLDTENKSFELTKRFFVTGNFSKYIPENATRIECNCDDAELMCLAFQKDGKTVLLLINPTKNEKSVTFDKETKLVVTNDTKNLEESLIPENTEIIITPRSVNTIIY